MCRKIFSLSTLISLSLVLAGCNYFNFHHFSEADIPEPPQQAVELAVETELAINPETGEEEKTYYFVNDVAQNYIFQYLLAPSLALNDFDNRHGFSRCTSGAWFKLTSDASEENPYILGQVNLSEGCAEDQYFFDFRVSPDGLILEILDEKTNEYVPYNEWFKTAEPLF